MAGKLRFASLLDATWVQLWETEVDSDGVMDWVEKGQLNVPIPGVHWLIVFAPTVLLFITKQAVLSVDIQTRLLNEFASRQEKVGLLFLWWASTFQPPGNYHVYVYYYWSCIQIMCTLSNPMCLQSIYVFLDCCDQKMPRHDDRRNLMAKHCPVWLMEKSTISEIVPLLLKEHVIRLFLTFVPGVCRVTQVC